MKAILRAGTMFVAAAWLAAPASVLAQAAPATSPPPTTNSTIPVGPSELQNFSLRGTVTRPADQTPVPAPTQASPARPPKTATPTRTPTKTAQDEPRRAAPATNVARPAPSASVVQTPQLTAPPVQAPPQTIAPVPTPPPATSAPVPEPTATDPFAIFRGLPLWPWIAAAIAIALGAAFLLWRRRPPSYAIAGSQFDLLVPAASEPEPEPLPRVVTPPASPPPRKPAAPTGIVASRLRPSLELGFHPLRCQVDDDRVAIEFELELFNAGTAPARAVLAEASLLNASATQDHELAAFFANPHGVGERLALIPPMKRVSFKSQVVAPRSAVQEYELAGRKAFVPVIAFNALYEWSGGKVQSSAAYLVGRDTQQDKLGPLRLDQGAREIQGLGARPLPSAVRT